MAKVVIMDHPLIQHKIGYIRREDTGTKDFRQTVSEIAMLICYEATRNLELSDVTINTPICETTVKELHNRLWNGGNGWGEIKLYKKDGTLIDHVKMENTGCEYGEYC